MDPIVTLACGQVRGRGADGVRAFLGIPYAVAPVGPALFAAPAPVPPWHGVRDAVQVSPTPPQAPYPPPFAELLDNPVIPGADFLTVNVWAPDGEVRGLPVLVWLPGGAFRNGSNAIPFYDGTAFARDGVVLVTVNYRLGAPGFAVLPDAPDNRGLLDQLAALRWVRDNIGAFGADPERVTVFGESAGAMSVATLLTVPAARGLFRRAIMQSGSAGAVADRADAAKVTAELAGLLGVEPTARGLSAVEPAALIEAQTTVATQLQANPDPARYGATVIARGLGIMSLFPVLDGTLITELPMAAIEAGAGADLDLMIGTNTDEFRFFTVPTGATAAVTAEMLPALAAARGWPAGAVERYTANRPDAAPGDVWCAITTDEVFRAPSARIARSHAAHGRTYLYEFAWPSGVSGLGACHALEIPFVFDTLDKKATAALAGPNPPQALADRMHAAWVAFATTGDPGWPRFEPDGRTVMTFADPADTLIEDPRGDELALW